MCSELKVKIWRNNRGSSREKERREGCERERWRRRRRQRSRVPGEDKACVCESLCDRVFSMSVTQSVTKFWSLDPIFISAADKDE